MTAKLCSLQSKGEVDSLAPLLFHKNKDLEITVTYIVQAIRDAIRDFDLLASELIQRYDNGERTAVATFVEACRHTCTGNLHWSLRTGRYGIGPDALAGG